MDHLFNIIFAHKSNAAIKSKIMDLSPSSSIPSNTPKNEPLMEMQKRVFLKKINTIGSRIFQKIVGRSKSQNDDGTNDNIFKKVKKQLIYNLLLFL